MKPDRIYGSTPIEEAKQRQSQIQYRLIWLQTLLDENNKELEALDQLKEHATKNAKKTKLPAKLLDLFARYKSAPQVKDKSVHEEASNQPQGTLLEFIKDMSQAAIEVEPDIKTLEEIQQRQDKLQFRNAWIKKLLKQTERELELLAIAEENQPIQTNS